MIPETTEWRSDVSIGHNKAARGSEESFDSVPQKIGIGVRPVDWILNWGVNEPNSVTRTLAGSNNRRAFCVWSRVESAQHDSDVAGESL